MTHLPLNTIATSENGALTGRLHRAPRAAAVSQCPAAWMNMLCVTLAGYALFGRGWAYLGVPPLYIGEVVLLMGVASVFLYGRLTGLFDHASIFALALLGGWGLWRTLPYLSVYGIDALRDAIIFGYAAFGIVVYGNILAEPRRLAVLIRRYGQFAVIYPAAIPGIWIVARFFEGSVPHWPWAEVPIFDAKGGDVLVHLAGILAFWVSGLAGEVSKVRMFLLACAIGMVGAFNRGGLLTVMAVGGFCLWLKPLNRNLWSLAMTAACGLAILAVSGFRVEIPGKQREISFEQLVTNISSVAADTNDADLTGTKSWRLRWWTDIYNYTFRGKYFWTGKGFGISLADDDGYQGSDWQGLLRSPHNGHLTMLARAGVPGFFLWLLVQGCWVWAMGRAYAHSRREDRKTWSALFFFLLAYWLALMTNATFDVFLEGPMGGVWFWTVFGAGLAAIWLYENDPQILNEGGATRSPISTNETS